MYSLYLTLMLDRLADILFNCMKCVICCGEVNKDLGKLCMEHACLLDTCIKLLLKDTPHVNDVLLFTADGMLMLVPKLVLISEILLLISGLAGKDLYEICNQVNDTHATCCANTCCKTFEAIYRYVETGKVGLLPNFNPKKYVTKRFSNVNQPTTSYSEEDLEEDVTTIPKTRGKFSSKFKNLVSNLY